MLLVTACQKDNFDIKEVKEAEEKVDMEHFNELTQRMSGSEGAIWMGCFQLETPFQMVDNDGEVYTIESMDDFIDLRASEVAIADFVYPLTLTHKESEESELVNNAAELALAFAECIPEDGFDDKLFPAYAINFESACYQLQYPVLVMNEEETETEVASEEDLSALLAGEEELFFVFPITLIDEEREEIEAEDAEVLFDLLLECEDDDDDRDYDYDGLECYDLLFPVTVILADGSEASISSPERFAYLLLEDKFKDFVYPITLIDEDDEAFDVASEEDLKDALEDCEDYDEDDEEWSYESRLTFAFLKAIFEDELCFEINFPIEITRFDGDDIEENLTLNGVDGVRRLLGQMDEDFYYHVVYPFDVMTREGLIAVENAEILEEVLESCTDLEDDDEDDYDYDNIWELIYFYEGSTVCYDIVYPLTVLAYDEDRNEEVIVFETNMAFEEFLNHGVDEDLVYTFDYPIEIIIDDELIEIEDKEALEELLERCFDGELDDDEEDDDRDNGSEILWIFYEGGVECFRIEFPITIERYDDEDEELEPITLENIQQFERLLGSGIEDQDIYYKLRFPFNIIWDGTTIEVEDVEFLKAVFERC